MKRWPRVMLVLAMWGAIGAGITVGVAWGAVRAYDDYLLQSFARGGDVRGRQTLLSRLPFIADRWPIAVPTGWPAPSMGKMVSGKCWSDMWMGDGALDSQSTHRIGFTSFGWPLRAIGADWWSVTHEDGTTVHREEAIVHAAWVQEYLGISRLPLRPLWPGFAIDTLLYGTLAWGLWQVPLFIRRRHRRVRNRCTRCGYSLAGLAAGAHCPECGRGDTAPINPPLPRAR